MKQSARAKAAATRVLEESGVVSFPIPIKNLAESHAVVMYESMEDDISGMLIPLKDSVAGKDWAIVVNSTHARTRQNFTLAHELGHLLLHGYSTPHADRTFKLRYRKASDATGSVLEEIEANQFAAELLMPEELLLEKLVDEGLEYVPPGEDEDDPRIAKLARDLKVSRQALTIRLSTLML